LTDPSTRHGHADAGTDTPSLAQVRTMNAVVEAFHAILYFAPEVQSRWAALGMEPRSEGYVAGRAAPLGPVGPEVATATFYNFSPTLFRETLPGLWQKADPTTVLAARAAGLQEVLERVGAPTGGLEELTALGAAAVAAAGHHGRPLAAANAGVAAPEEPFARAWQVLTVLREHRGDGHVALLTVAGLGPVEALVVMAGWQGAVSARFLRRSRMWSEDDWAAAVARLRARGVTDGDGALTAEGTALRDRLERDTDRLALAPYEALGRDGTQRLFDLVRPLALALAEGDAYPRRPHVPEALPVADDRPHGP
jgi:hypothetical protein